ncbi:MAG: BrnA antitoxin family protein [Planctomycetes bacterium]|nr:BrnA antitoxin family protein [Planctomycetota bacterium]
MSRTNKKRLPRFKNEEQEHKFWATHSALDYFGTGRAGKVTLPNLKPSVKTISIRLPEMMLEELKLLANKRDVPYQSLLKMFLAERIEAELGRLVSG